PPAGGYATPPPAGGYATPPPAGGYATPAPGAGYAPPSMGGRGAFDPKTVSPLDWGILAVGFLTLIFSFFGFYTASASGGGFGRASASASAWHEIFGGGFFGWAAMILGVIGTIGLVLTLFSPQTHLPLPGRSIALLGFALGLLFEILAIFIHPKFFHQSANIGGIHYSASFGHGVTFWISLILLAVGTVLSLIRAQQTNTQLPGALNNLPKIGR
ncbi:MAG: hypothetical protein M3N95_16550, partial [Actinomycetota bacterium]|nr:hypothetical protein [Actinomycetota bacterium]